MRRCLLPLCLLVLLLAACGDPRTALDHLAPEHERSVAVQLMAQLAARDFASIEAQFDPSQIDADTPLILKDMAGQMPAGPPTHAYLVGVRLNDDAAGRTILLVHEYQYGDVWMVARVLFRRQGEQEMIEGFHVDRRTTSYESANDFGFEGKGVLQPLFLAVTVAVPLFCVGVFVLACRTRFAKPWKRWPWLLFIAVGVGQIGMDWSTGGIRLEPLMFQLLGAGAFRNWPGPWILWVSVPLGAILFLRRRDKLRAPAEASAPPETPAPPQAPESAPE